MADTKGPINNSSSSVPLMLDIEGQYEEDDLDSELKRDFAYRNNVAGAAKHIRMGFLRKVYSLLGMQLAITTVIASICLFTPVIKEFVHSNPWLLMVAFVAALGLLIALHVKRKETPINLILLGAFIKYSDIGAFFLYAGLWLLILAGFMQLIVGGRVADTGLAVVGALLFCGFIIFDTHMIMTRVSPEEYIMATIELYLDIVNLFIEILKILERVNRK
ncbi:hypothetical protein TCAL_13291 [Tigriopus californicus]|uniref:Transmembrane BAX inhibitor motif-containing protein 4 n=1 Tax=Tigriopus californicus TaxID=6832 RepID=A0A553NX75_TIGCA|nr:hypothetical protein TCAL_13291 [Tigriopus californicus]